MGSLGAATNRGTSTTTTAPVQIITQDQFEQATRAKRSAERRENLARLMYPAPKGTVLVVGPNFSLTKMEDTPGALWKASDKNGYEDGLLKWGEDWVKDLAHERTK